MATTAGRDLTAGRLCPLKEGSEEGSGASRRRGKEGERKTVPSVSQDWCGAKRSPAEQQKGRRVGGGRRARTVVSFSRVTHAIFTSLPPLRPPSHQPVVLGTDVCTPAHRSASTCLSHQTPAPKIPTIVPLPYTCTRCTARHSIAPNNDINMSSTPCYVGTGTT
ncbi:hypothetical protein E2C01_020322 [Portunus trituberculatus]|uniref:Uncharacterized protein n=1 Tax=Portunus trituberculatus TaxID=210409 RepID=A0A5B7E068_PORTR|nr:hypothetical protein [Portunus trituberculatus]